jgi:hypothetical protein
MQPHDPYNQPHGQQYGYGPPEHQQQGYGDPHAGYGQQPQMAPAPAAGNQRLNEALGLIDMLSGEEVVYAIQADGFFLGANPLLKLIGTLQAFMVTITGGHIRIFLVVTNQRLLVIKSTQIWCGINRAKVVNTIALAGVKEVGSSKETHLCCVHTRTIQVQSLTQLYNVVIKKMGDPEIRNFVTNLSAVIVAHTSRASI